MKFRFAQTALLEGRVAEFGHWLEGRLVFGNPVKNKPWFTPRWASEGFTLPADSVGSLRDMGDDLLVLTQDKPWRLPRGGYVGRVSSGEIIVAEDAGFKSLVANKNLQPIYDLAFYDDRVAYWDRCDRKVTYKVPAE